MILLGKSLIAIFGGGGGGGNVVGAASSTDNAIARFDGTTGKLLQDSTVVINDDNELAVPNKVIVTKSVENNSEPALKLNGISLAGTGSTDGHGCGLYLSYNVSSNRQFVFADTESGNGLRFIGSYVDGFNVGTQSQIGLTLGGYVHTNDLKVDVLKDSAGSSGSDGQVLKKVGGLVLWSNP